MKTKIGLFVFVVLAATAAFFLSQSKISAQAPVPPAAAELAPLSAAVSSAFSYQGKLTNGGRLVNGYCDFIWNLYAASSSGSALSTDTSANQLVTNGLFTVQIAVPSSVITGSALFVEVQVRCPTGVGGYTTLTPRQELVAAPYALGLRLPFAHTINSSVAPIFSVTNSSSSSNSPSLLGSSVGGDGVQGLSTGAASADNGVYGETNSTATAEAGVKGVSTGGAAGVYGSASSATAFGGSFTNSTTTTSGGALYADGDAKQSLAGDGFVKAGVFINDCGTAPSITRYFNNVNTSAITVSAAGSGTCLVDFNFDVSARYIVATSYSSTARMVTFLPTATTDTLQFYKYTDAGALVDGDIMVLVY